MVPFESLPIAPFHRRLTAAAGAGQFAEGFSIGVIGIALALAKHPLGLTDWGMGALGAASLFGLFFGSLIGGAISDRFGRWPIFSWSMVLFTAFGCLQYLSNSVYELFALRFLLGVTLGADYVASKAMVTEYSPVQSRGTILSFLALSWTSGYFSAFVSGYIIRGAGPDAWRFALLASALPSALAFLLRFRSPESAQWLTRSGKLGEARLIVTKYFGANVSLPVVDTVNQTAPEGTSELFKRPLVKNLVVGGIFQCSQVIPTYALGTFLPIVMAKLRLGDGYTGALIYNILFLVGALIGPFLIDRIARRTLLIQGFVWMAVLLATLVFWRTAPAIVSVSVFALFAFVLSVAGILQFVYPPELFPTEFRARGVGLVAAFSRVGSTVTTFLLPPVVERYGIQTALSFCMGVMIVAAVICFLCAPETLRRRLV